MSYTQINGNIISTTTNTVEVNGNYYGSDATSSIYWIKPSITVTTFNNSYILLGAGGVRTGPIDGQNAIYNAGTISTLNNYGKLLGGGGAGSINWALNYSGGNGGAGGGGGAGPGLNSTGSETGNGGSLINANANGFTGRIGNSIVSSAGYSGQGGGGGGPGGNGADGAECNTYIISGNLIIGRNASTWKGGAGGLGAWYTYQGYHGGGGGYGGQYANNGGGGGGGGGLSDAGKGGYSIYNVGIIGNLYNSQGGYTATTNIYGPLFYAGNLPNKYYIRIDSTTNYGQLYYTGWRTVFTKHFPMGLLQYLPFYTSITSITSYPTVINNGGSNTNPSFTTIGVNGGKNCIYFNNNASNYPYYLYFTFSNPTKFTICFWIYIDSNSYTTAVSISSVSNLNTPSLQCDFSDSTIYLFSAMNQSNYWLNVNTNFVYVNRWTHVAYTIDQSTYKAELYVDTTLRVSATGNNALNQDTNHIIIGRSGDSVRGFKGYIREFMLYNRVLEQSEISYIYSTTV